MCTGAEAAAMAAIAQKAAGEKQLGPTAPAYTGGGAGFGGGFSSNPFQPPSASDNVEAQKVGNVMQQTIAELAPSTGSLPADTTEDEIGGNADILARAGQLSGDPAVLGGFQREPEMGPLGKFFGNLDEGLQSPSKILGLGLLGQIDPKLGYAGLLAQGLLGGPNNLLRKR